MFNLDQHVIESTKNLAVRAELVLKLAEMGKTPEAGAALLAMGREIGSALTELSRAMQAHSILESVLDSLCERAETMQRAQGIPEADMQAAFAWKAAPVDVWHGLPLVSVEFCDEADEGDGEA